METLGIILKLFVKKNKKYNQCLVVALLNICLCGVCKIYAESYTVSTVSDNKNVTNVNQ